MGNVESTPAIPWEDADRISRVLLNPLILLKILKRCDFHSVLVVKATSRFGRIFAIEALRDHVDLLPCVETDRDGTNTHMNTFKNNFPPEARLPVKLVVDSWSTDVAAFFHEYGGDIIEVDLFITHCQGFTFEDDSFLLPRLERTTFELSGRSVLNRSVKDYFDLFSRIVSGSKSSFCQVTIPADGLLEFLPLNLPDKITHLDIADQNLFEALVQNSHWPRLGHLTIGIRSHQGQGPYRSDFLNSHGGQLKQLSLVCDGGRTSLPDGFELPTLPQLTHLTLDNVHLSQNVLLQNLRKLNLREGADEQVLATLVRSGNVFVSVSELIYDLYPVLRPEIVPDNIRRFTNSFPNLSSFTLEGDSKTLEYGGRIIFWYMVNLEELVFSAYSRMDMVKVLTGFSMRDVFVDRTEWSQFLGGRRDTICNLPRLRILTLDQDYRSYRGPVGELESEYLFTAAFTQMPALHKLKFKNIRLGNEQVKTIWRNSGREICEL